MKNFYKSIWVMNGLFYFDILALSLRISKVGLEEVNPFWIISPYIFILIYLGYFKVFQGKERKVYALLFTSKIAIMLLGYIAGKYSMISTSQMIIFLILITFIGGILLIEYSFINNCRSTIDNREKNLPSLSTEDLSIITNNEKLSSMLIESRNMSFKLQFHTFAIVVSYAMLVMSIVFINNLNTNVVGLIILLLSIALLISFTYHFYSYFSKKNHQAKIFSAIFVVLSFCPYLLLFATDWVLETKSSWLFIFLAVFVIPIWYFYKKESKDLWNKFLIEFSDFKKKLKM